MKILFLHGAIKNAGDFLIAHRSKLLIRELIPKCEVFSAWEGEDSDKISEYIEKVDGIVFGGGPFFTNNLYPGDIKLVNDLEKLKIPLINIGGGWFGRDSEIKSVMNYNISSQSIELLNKILLSSSELSCRDWYTTNMLKGKGLNASMHGCPAWYDLEYIDKIKLKQIGDISKICISDPADVKNSRVAVSVIEYLRRKYPNAEIKYILHRGAWKKSDGAYGERRRKGIESVLKSEGIEWIDISGGYKGFEVYDLCDLHVGFRVHAHIYNLSHRNRSILIEEDGRGAGVNQALGLGSIHAYDNRRCYKDGVVGKVINRIFPMVNRYVVEELENQINHIEYTDGLEYEQAFLRMKFYYSRMKNHILKIEKW